jgi:hypothetical protein
LRKLNVLLRPDSGLKASYDTRRRYAIEERGWRVHVQRDAA